MAKSDEKDKGTSKSRRGFLKKAGTAAVLLPPAMAVLSKPSRAKMVRSATGGGDHHDYPSMNKKVAKKKVAKKKVAKKKVA
ncbi:MAG: twin-arginine translocation signal domain-containing protein, partial [Gammaproteobacteria bacterium]